MIYGISRFDRSQRKSSFKLLLANKNIQTWLLIGWQLCCQPIRNKFWKKKKKKKTCQLAWIFLLGIFFQSCSQNILNQMPYENQYTWSVLLCAVLLWFEGWLLHCHMIHCLIRLVGIALFYFLSIIQSFCIAYLWILGSRDRRVGGNIIVMAFGGNYENVLEKISWTMMSRSNFKNQHEIWQKIIGISHKQTKLP